MVVRQPKALRRTISLHSLSPTAPAILPDLAKRRVGNNVRHGSDACWGQPSLPGHPGAHAPLVLPDLAEGRVGNNARGAGRTPFGGTSAQTPGGPCTQRPPRPRRRRVGNNVGAQVGCLSGVIPSKQFLGTSGSVEGGRPVPSRGADSPGRTTDLAALHQPFGSVHSEPPDRETMEDRFLPGEMNSPGRTSDLATIPVPFGLDTLGTRVERGRRTGSFPGSGLPRSYYGSRRPLPPSPSGSGCSQLPWHPG